MFRRKYEITLNRVHDKITVREGEERLELTVDEDPGRIISGLNKAQKMLQNITEETPEDERKRAALFFAETLFGSTQAEKLMAFYQADALAVISICGNYFRERLSKLIVKAQKK